MVFPVIWIIWNYGGYKSTKYVWALVFSIWNYGRRYGLPLDMMCLPWTMDRKLMVLKLVLDVNRL